MNSFPNSSYSTEGEAVLRPSLLFRPLELDPDLPSSAGAELGLDFPDFSSGEEYSGLTSSLGSEILMGLLEDLTWDNSSAGSEAPALILKTVLPRQCLSKRFSGPETALQSSFSTFLVPFFISMKVVRVDSRSSKEIGHLEPDILKSWLRSVLWWRISSLLWWSISQASSVA